MLSRSACPFIFDEIPSFRFGVIVEPERTWQDIVADAARASREDNLQRLSELRDELAIVLDHRNEVLRASVKSDTKLPAKTA